MTCNIPLVHSRFNFAQPIIMEDGRDDSIGSHHPTCCEACYYTGYHSDTAPRTCSKFNVVIEEFVTLRDKNDKPVLWDCNRCQQCIDAEKRFRDSRKKNNDL